MLSFYFLPGAPSAQARRQGGGDSPLGEGGRGGKLRTQARASRAFEVPSPSEGTLRIGGNRAAGEGLEGAVPPRHHPPASFNRVH